MKKSKCSFLFTTLLTGLLLSQISVSSGANITVKKITGLSLLPTAYPCNDSTGRGILYRNSEVEPYIAVNPADPNNIIAAWQQDRMARLGGAQADGFAVSQNGGQTWTIVNPFIPFTRCSGAGPGDAGFFDRSSDPWITFSENGTAYAQALVFDDVERDSGAVAMSISYDKGATWTSPIRLDVMYGVGDGRPLLDKNTLTTDYTRPGYVYAVHVSYNITGSAIIFTRSMDGGVTWESPHHIYDPGNDISGSEIGGSKKGAYGNVAETVVLPGGTLVITLTRDYTLKDGSLKSEMVLISSKDAGKTWDKRATVIAPITYAAQAYDPELVDGDGNPIVLRDGDGQANPAVNRMNGYLYVAYMDFNSNNMPSIKITRSTDKGRTWSTPAVVSQRQNTQAFTPRIAIAANGNIGLIYYDMRNDSLTGGSGPLSADVFFATFDQNLVFKSEVKLTSKSMDIRQAPLLFGSSSVIPGGFFLGDYMGVAASGNDFVAAYIVTNNLGLPVFSPNDTNAFALDENNRQDVYFARIPAN